MTGQPEAEKGTGFFLETPVRNVTGGMHAEATERRSISGDEATGFSASRLKEVMQKGHVYVQAASVY